MFQTLLLCMCCSSHMSIYIYKLYTVQCYFPPHFLYPQWDAILTKRALVSHSPYILPKYTFLNLSSDVIRSTACFRLCDHILRFETAARNQSKPPTCDLCDADDIQDEQHVLIHCVIPHGDFSPQKTSLVKFSSFLLDLFPGTVLLAQVCCQVV